MGELATVGTTIGVLAALVVLVFGRDAHLLRAVNAIRTRRGMSREAVQTPRPWSHCDALIRRGEALSSDATRLRAILDSDRLANSLAELYPQHPLLSFDNVRMPVWAVPVPAEQRHSVDSILGHLEDRASPQATIYPDQYCPGGAPSFRRKHKQRAELPESDRHRLASNPTYSLSQASLDASGKLSLSCHMGRYFTHLATTRALGQELIGALSRADGEVPLWSLPMRQWLHANVSDPVMDGSRRDAALGISTFVVARRREGGYYGLLPERSSRTATDARLMHVCPAGMLQPFSDSPIANAGDFSVLRNFAREYVEELYAMEVAERPGKHFDEFDSESHLPLQRLEQHLASTPGSSLRLSGFCVNLMTLQPEICLLLFIDDPDWLRSEARAGAYPLKFGWEIGEVDDHQQSWLVEINDDLNLQIDGPLRPSQLVPQAAAALQLGLDLIRADQASL